MNGVRTEAAKESAWIKPGSIIVVNVYLFSHLLSMLGVLEITPITTQNGMALGSHAVSQQVSVPKLPSWPAMPGTRGGAPDQMMAPAANSQDAVMKPPESSIGTNPDVREEMALVPPGPFLYGEDNRREEISLHAFYIDLYEVTNAAYSRVRPHTYSASHANHPMVGVTWYDAEQYCQAVGKRLPSEQEWEKAARGTDGRRFPWGDTFEQAKTNANGFLLMGQAMPVGGFPAGRSPYGVFDLAGNVWEWTASDTGFGEKIIRGGAWYAEPAMARSALRTSMLPNRSNLDIGFRCAKDAPNAEADPLNLMEAR